MSNHSPADTTPTIPLGDRSALQVLVIGEALIDIVQNGRESTERVRRSPANAGRGLGLHG